MDSQANRATSNYFVARPAFWRAWLDINEKLFALCEGADSPLRQSLVYATNYSGAVERKVFLMERIVSLLLTINPAWKVHCYNTFVCGFPGRSQQAGRQQARCGDERRAENRHARAGDFRNILTAFMALRDKIRKS